jgi:tRNA(adenine34) deaminase
MMKQAIEQARIAENSGEVPIGAVLSDIRGNIIAKAYNQTEKLIDPTAHAEILALRKGAHHLLNYRLLNTILYVTIEPCVMCMGAIINARISTLVYGAQDHKWGGCGSLYDFSSDHRFNHRLSVIKGVCENESREIMQEFFRSKRKKQMAIP